MFFLAVNVGCVHLCFNKVVKRFHDWAIYDESSGTIVNFVSMHWSL
jgi:hypothetical protein